VAACTFATAASGQQTFNARGKLVCGMSEVQVGRATVAIGLNARSAHIEFLAAGSNRVVITLDLDIQRNDGTIEKGHVRAYEMQARCPQRDWHLIRETGSAPGSHDDFEALIIQLWSGGRMAGRVAGRDPRSDDLAWLLEINGTFE
jgi:hypothetical protein